MYSLLTGRPHMNSRDERKIAEQPFTADAHRAAMRRLLVDASEPPNDMTAETLIQAAHVHAVAAETAPVSLDGTRTLPRDGDAI